MEFKTNLDIKIDEVIEEFKKSKYTNYEQEGKDYSIVIKILKQKEMKDNNSML